MNPVEAAADAIGDVWQVFLAGDGENAIRAKTPIEIAQALAAAGLLVTPELTAEVEHLRAWKHGAMQVLGRWERVWEAAGSPGPLGGSKADNVAAEIERLRAERVTPGQAAPCTK